jgi:hypothetical protein
MTFAGNRRGNVTRRIATRDTTVLGREVEMVSERGHYNPRYYDREGNPISIQEYVEMQRYSTEAEAIEGHRKLLQEYKSRSSKALNDFFDDTDRRGLGAVIADSVAPQRLWKLPDDPLSPGLVYGPSDSFELRVGDLAGQDDSIVYIKPVDSQGPWHEIGYLE